MNVVRARPPLFELIDAKFKIAGKPAIFCYGRTIYNPEGVKITPMLHAHEAVHAGQQGKDPEGWWLRYIDDPQFRLAEEIPAHRAEYFRFCLGFPDREQRKKYLSALIERLSSPLYESVVSAEVARQLVKPA